MVEDMLMNVTNIQDLKGTSHRIRQRIKSQVRGLD